MKFITAVTGFDVAGIQGPFKFSAAWLISASFSYRKATGYFVVSPLGARNCVQIYKPLILNIAMLFRFIAKKVLWKMLNLSNEVIQY